MVVVFGMTVRKDPKEAEKTARQQGTEAIESRRAQESNLGVLSLDSLKDGLERALRKPTLYPPLLIFLESFA